MSRMQTFAVVGCGILAGVGLAFIRRRRKKTSSSFPSLSSTAERRYVFGQPNRNESIQEDRLADVYFSCAETVVEAPFFEDEEDWDLGEFI